MILEFVINLKRKYEEKFGDVPLSEIDGKPCIVNWAEKLGTGIDILANLTVRQNGNYVIFKYMKFEVLFSRDNNISYSEFWNIYNGIYRECRGVTIDVKNECYVSRPFDKFFGINERTETSESAIRKILMNASVVEFSNKIDGSIIISRWYDDDVFVSSSGMLSNTPIIDKAKLILSRRGYKELLIDYSDWTCMFESVSNLDVHIVSYGPEMHGLHLIGMRNVKSGELKSYSEICKIAEYYGIRSTEFVNMGFNEILQSRSNYKAEEKEGYVMYVDGLLIKIKCDDYIFMHKMWMTKCSMNGLVQAVYKDRIDDLMSGVPDNFKAVLNDGIKTIALYEKLMEDAVKKYESIAPKERVEFFKWIKTIPSHIGRYISNNYLGRPLSYLVLRDDGKNVQYLKYSEIEKLIEMLEKESGDI